MWSNQATNSFYFAVHNDGDSAQTWQSTSVYTSSSDDHINLKTASGNVYAVVKTTISDRIVLLACQQDAASHHCASSDDWNAFVVYQGNEGRPTRPTLLIDTDNQTLYVFATLLDGARAITYKQSDLHSISFPAGAGTAFIASDLDTTTNNPTTSKHNVSGMTDLVIVASDENTHYYLHNDLDLTIPTPTPTNTPSATPTPTFTPTSTASPSPTSTTTTPVSSTPTQTATHTATASPTDTSTPLPTPTNTPLSTVTTTLSPSPTMTPSHTTSAPTSTATPTSTLTPIATVSLSPTMESSAQASETPSPSVTPSSTPTETPMPTGTATPASTYTATHTVTPTFTATPTASSTPSATPQATSSATLTSTTTPIASVTATSTSSPTATPTNTATATPNAPATLHGSITLQGRPPPPDSKWVVPLTVQLSAIDAAGQDHSTNLTTNEHGEFTITDLVPATYDIAIKSDTTLQIVQRVVLGEGVISIDFGVLWAGDASNDNKVTLTDLSILITTFGKGAGEADFDERADFNADTYITLLDFSLLASNFEMQGDIVTNRLTNFPGWLKLDGFNVKNSRTRVRAGIHQLPESASQRAFFREWDLMSMRRLHESQTRLTLSLPEAVSNLGEEFDVNVEVNTQDQLVDGIAVYVAFDPGFLREVDISPQPIFPIILHEANFDNETGTISFAAGTLSAFPVGNFELATITFESITTTDGTLLSFVSQPPNITEATYNGLSILELASSATIIIDPELSGCYDFDNDGRVDVDDINLVSGFWRQTTADGDSGENPSDAGIDSKYDLDDDGTITIQDILLITNHLGASCP